MSDHAAMPRPEFDPFAAAANIWRVRWWLAMFSCVCMAICWLYLTQIKTGTYRSNASVAFIPSRTMVQNAEATRIRDLGAAFSTNTEMGVLTSLDLLGALVTQLDLINDPELLGDQPASLDAAVDGLRRMIEVTNVRFSFIVEIAVTSVDPAKSQRIANGLVDLYMARQMMDQTRAQTDKVALLKTRVGQIKQDLDLARNKLQSRQQNAIAASEKDVAQMSEKLRDIRVRRRNMEQALTGTSDKVQLIASLNAQTPQVALGLLDASRSHKRLAALRQSERSLAQKHKAVHENYITVQDLRLEVDAMARLYENFLTRLKHAAAEQGLHQSSSRILSYAVFGKPTGLAPILILGMVALGSLIFGIYLNLVLVTARNRHLA